MTRILDYMPSLHRRVRSEMVPIGFEFAIENLGRLQLGIGVIQT